MEQMIGLGVLVLLAVPVLLIVALVSIGGLKRRIFILERDVSALRASRQQAPASPAQGTEGQAQPSPRESTSGAPTLAEIMRTPGMQATANGSFDAPAGSASTAASTPTPPSPMQSPAPVARQPSPTPPRAGTPSRPHRMASGSPNAIEIGIRAVKRWFTVGNVPVKVGMLVLLAGVAALLKYASDQGWLTMPIELRLAGISAAALVGLALGWRQRVQKRAFALALQGGAIGVLLLTVFAAFKLYGLLPSTAAFGLSVALVAGLGMLAVLQDSRTLAILGILAGFMAPIWLATGSGSHVALFSYYAILNAAILAIAWWRPWRVLNLLGFVFTFGIGIWWGVLEYEPAKYASTEPFLLLFFAFYLLIPILYARRRPASLGDRIDGCLLFGTPLVVFSLQAALLDGARMPLAFHALGLAALYALLARLLIHRERYAVLGQGYALLAVGFATLAVPLALSARATASVFALEGAALAWLGLRQHRRLPQVAGAGLQLVAALALAIGAQSLQVMQTPVANAGFMGALLIALAGFASAWAYRHEHDNKPFALLYYLWGLAWWCGNGFDEITAFAAPTVRPDLVLAFAALTGWLAAEVHRRRPASALALTTLAGFVVAVPLAFVQADVHTQPFAGYGGWAWLLFALLGVRSLLCLRTGSDRFAAWAQFAWWLVWPVVLSLACTWLADRFALASGWALALQALPWLALAAVSLQRWSWLATPLGESFDHYRTALQVTVFAVLGLGWIVALSDAGSSAPLPWLPLLNPLDLAQLAVLALLARWLWSPQAPAVLQRVRIFVLAAAGFVLVTVITLRAVNHWGGVGWGEGMLSGSLAQTSLTVVWSVLGVLGWVIGSRRGQRALWLAGAVLMAVVLVKLVLVDRGNLGNGLGIASFIAYGLLCTLVGYFAPAPPRAAGVEEVPA